MKPCLNVIGINQRSTIDVTVQGKHVGIVTGQRLRIIRTAVCACAILITSAALAQKNLQVYATSLFPAANPTNFFPLLIDVQNTGPSTKGEITLGTPDGTIHYPVELPSHSRKEFIAYPSIAQLYEPLDLKLITDNGNIETEWDNTNLNGTGPQVLMIADEGGSVNYLKGIQVPGAEMALSDVYGKPKILPDRGVGYEGFRVVLLGPGSERMTDTAVKALKEYVLLGGTLAFFGGASPQILRDPRWQDVLPVKDVETKTLPSLHLNFSNFATDISHSITVAVSQKAAGSQVLDSDYGIPIVASRPYGAGKTLFFAADPFESPFRDLDNRAAFFTAFLDLKGPTSAYQMLGAAAFALGANPYTVNYGPGSSTSYVTGPSTTTTTTTTTATTTGSISTAGGPSSSGWTYRPPVSQANPFQIKLPPTQTVFEILLVYVAVVVPLNLLILRKLKRGEWAWLTAPVISVAFAFIFFEFAGSLYATGLSKETSGIILADSSSGNSYFLGRTQIFFPHSGGYDLKLHDVDFLIPGDPMEDDYSGMRYRGSNRGASNVNPIDVGQIIVPNLTTSNLSFYEFSIGQKLNNQEWVTGKIKQTDGGLKGEITNLSPYKIDHIKVLGFGKSGATDKTLAPGQTVQISSDSTTGAWDAESQLASQISSDRFIFSGTVTGFHPGTPIGTEVGNGTIQLIETLGEGEHKP
jgi:hypothetical protein